MVNTPETGTHPALQKGGIDNRKDFGQAVLERCGGFNRQPPMYQTELGDQLQELVDGFMRDLKAWGDGYGAEQHLIRHDPRLTVEGQIEKLTPVQARWSKQFNDDLVKRCRTLQDQHFTKVKAIYELPPEVVNGDPVVLFLQSQEIRAFLRSLSVDERIRLAMNSADPQLLHALDTCPDCLQLLPDGMRERAYEARVKRRRGPQLAQAEDERLALERITSVLRNVPNAVDFVRIAPGDLLFMPATVYGADREGINDEAPEAADISILNVDAASTAMAA